MDEGFYKVYTTNYSFIMSVLLAGSTYTIWYGDVDNREGPCVEITYDTDRKEICKLQIISYYTRCSKNKQLVKGEGTIEMLQSVLKLMIGKFPNIKRVLFNDVSSIECNDGTNILVSYASLAQHGKTWYERYFAARMIHKHDRNKLKEFKDLLSTKPTKNVFSFFDNKEYESWHEFFIKMREQHGCEFFGKHQKELQNISKMQLMYSEWYIRESDIAKYEYSVKKYKKVHMGGKVVLQNGVTTPLSFEDIV